MFLAVEGINFRPFHDPTGVQNQKIVLVANIFERIREEGATKSSPER